jgi:hypothetical protein
VEVSGRNSPTISSGIPVVPTETKPIQPKRYARPAVNLTEDRAPLVSINAGCSKKLGGALAAVDDLGALL